MAKYKVGDRVRIRDDLRIGMTYCRVGVAEGMMRFKGKWVTVTYADYSDDTYRVNDSGWWWRPEMFSDEDFVEDLPLFVTDAVQWLGDHYTDGSYTKVFGGEYSLESLTEMFTSKEIMQRIREKGKRK